MNGENFWEQDNSLENSNYTDPVVSGNAVAAYFSKVYGWMAFALLLSGLAAWLTGHNVAIQQALFTGYTPMVLFGIELALVFGISAAINNLSASVCTLLFVLYSVVNGLTLGVIFLVYTETSIMSTFLVTAITFGVMSIYGYTTKSDLTGWGKILMFALIGLVVATLVNFFMKSSMMSLIISGIGVLVFVGLTAYDTQKLKDLAYTATDEESMTKLAVYGALDLYLDFVNLFLYLLRFLGNRRD
ncbi:MAG: Bax inhibitor-1/YccA family protein [Paludibacteraceae bacterium]|nr:Bax inhibitor-1/YccA family protein [Paludibacteraceae bacterium]